jgi:hypothetical protein
MSVLHVAAAFAKEEILRYLVLKKADVLAQGGVSTSNLSPSFSTAVFISTFFGIYSPSKERIV